MMRCRHILTMRRYWATRLRRLRIKSNRTRVETVASPPLPGGLLAGKTILITGAGRGIGKNLALAARNEGALVCYTDRDPDSLKALGRLLQQGGHRGYLCDIADNTSIDKLWGELQRENVRVDAMAHCAGSKATRIRFADMTPQQWNTSFSTNVQGPAYLTQLATMAMTADGRRGSVLFISSVHGEITGGWPHYSASKAALNMMVKELALELGPAGIRVNAVAPGWTAEPDEPGADFFEHAPLGQTAIPPEYISRACIFLLSDNCSAYTTGTCLTVDAGVSLRSYRTPAFPPEGDAHTRWPLVPDRERRQGGGS